MYNVVPRFTVVMPIYNKEPHIQRSISSVLNQTFQDFELIIVNDASTDNSMNEVQKFTDSRIRFFNRDTPGFGGYAARNLGIEKSKSDWIAFLDADDEWMSEYLEKMHALSLSFPEAQMLCCGWRFGDKNTLKINPYLKKHINSKAKLLGLKEYLKIHSKGMDLTNTNVTIVSKSILNNLKGFPLPNSNCLRAGDGKTWLHAMLLRIKVAWLPYAGAIYYQDCVNMVTKKVYKFEENCLISFIDEYLIINEDFQYKKLLSLYRDKRVLNYIHSVDYDIDIDINYFENYHILFFDKRFVMYVFFKLIPKNYHKVLFPTFKKISLLSKINLTSLFRL